MSLKVASVPGPVSVSAGSGVSSAGAGSAAAVFAGSGLAIAGGTPVFASPVAFMSTGLTPADIDAATAVLKSGMLRAAKKCEELEQRLGSLSGAKHAMTCANGTCALQLAYEPLVRPGDDVLVPAWSYIATVSMVVARGANPVFVDALPDTMQIDVADAERRITRRTTAIAATHLYGCPVDIDAVERLAAKHGLKVIYDCAQGHLATYKGKGMGAFGDAVTYSFYATKNLGTGEGGLITCNDDDLAREIKLLRSHGETDKYLHEYVGYNYRMNDIAGAIGCSKLDRLPAETASRQAVAKQYDRMIAEINRSLGGRALLKSPATTPGAEPVYHLYVVQLESEQSRCTRDQFCEALKAEGVPTAVHYPRSLTRQPAFRKFVDGPHGQGHPTVADGLSSRVFALPMHHALTAEQIKGVGEALARVAKAAAR
jgi:perosamine synthetase